MTTVLARTSTNAFGGDASGEKLLRTDKTPNLPKIDDHKQNPSPISLDRGEIAGIQAGNEQKTEKTNKATKN